MNKYEKDVIRLCRTFHATEAYVKELDDAWSMCTYLQSTAGSNKPMDECVVLAFCDLLRNESLWGYQKSSDIFSILTCNFKETLFPSQIRQLRECFREIFTKIHSFPESSSHLTVLRFILDAYEPDESLQILKYFWGVVEQNALIIIPWGLYYLQKQATSEEIKAECMDLLTKATQSENPEFVREAELYLQIGGK